MVEWHVDGGMTVVSRPSCWLLVALWRRLTAPCGVLCVRRVGGWERFPRSIMGMRVEFGCAPPDAHPDSWITFKSREDALSVLRVGEVVWGRPVGVWRRFD